MAIRTDITFNWEINPRQITVDAPSTEFTMQDILDTLRHNEALPSNIDNPSIVVGSGKVVLDDLGNAVGLTVQLVNATIGFETRSGPAWIECNLSGGNLSGLEANGTTVTTQVTHNNPFVNINKTSSVSATISESQISDRLDYDGILHYDENNVNGVGQSHPVGTSANPVNNISDGGVIAQLYSLHDVTTYSDVNLDRDSSRFNVSSKFNDTVFYPHGFKMTNCTIDHMIIDGDFNDSAIHLHNCEITNALNIHGKLKDSSISGRVSISANQSLDIIDCESGVAGQGSPIFDMQLNEDTMLSVRNFSGGGTLENCDTPSCTATLEFAQGKPHLEPSCTDGYVSVRGTATLDDRSNGTIVDITSLIDPAEQRRIFEDVALPITSEEVAGETHLTIWTDDTLTDPIRVINIGTSEIPKRINVP